MMLRGNSPDLEELRAIIQDIHCDDRRAADVIARLKKLLKRRHLDFEAISVDGLVKEVSSLVRPDAVAKRVTLECDVESGLPPVSGDRVHLSQVLINLIINGMDSITSSDRPKGLVRIAARPAAERAVELAVIDSGAGIPPHMLSRLFEPFFTTKANGMGMGLAVSRTIVEAHGGHFWAENNPGRRRDVSIHDPDGQGEPVMNGIRDGFPGRRRCVIPASRSRACWARRACRWARSIRPRGCSQCLSPEDHGCIVTDLFMPDMSGLELQAALADAGVVMPIVFLTGRADIPSTVHAMRDGAVDFLEKTAPCEVLLDAIRRALENRCTRARVATARRGAARAVFATHAARA